MGAAVMVVRRKNFTKNGDASLRLFVLRAGVAARLGNRGNRELARANVQRSAFHVGAGLNKLKAEL